MEEKKNPRNSGKFKSFLGEFAGPASWDTWKEDLINASKAGASNEDLKLLVFERTGKLPSSDIWMRWKRGVTTAGVPIPDNENPDIEIRDTLEICDLYFHQWLSSQATVGGMNATMGIFMLCNRFSSIYTRNPQPDHIKHEHTGEVGLDVTVTFDDNGEA